MGWTTYRASCEAMQLQHRMFGIWPRPLRIPLCHQMTELLDLDGQANEVLLMHGTTDAAAKAIVQFGFDERVSNGMYGDGLYFTPESCKAMQYARDAQAGILVEGETESLRTILIARVTVGDPFYTSESMSGRRPPERNAGSVP